MVDDNLHLYIDMREPETVCNAGYFLSWYVLRQQDCWFPLLKLRVSKYIFSQLSIIKMNLTNNKWIWFLSQTLSNEFKNSKSTLIDIYNINLPSCFIDGWSIIIPRPSFFMVCWWPIFSQQGIQRSKSVHSEQWYLVNIIQCKSREEDFLSETGVKRG